MGARASRPHGCCDRRAPPAAATAVDALKEGRELRFVVRRRIDPGAGTLTLTTRLLR